MSRAPARHRSNFAFWMISIMHDNPLLPIFRNPYKLLGAAGLEPGQRVLEVGCGPGFFTIPAATIVGDAGFIYAVDVHPRAIDKVRQKTAKAQAKNVEALLANASDPGLPDESIDLGFMLGVRYVAGGLEEVLGELHRVLKSDGILAFEQTWGSDEELRTEVGKHGFRYVGKQGRILSFSRQGETG